MEEGEAVSRMADKIPTIGLLDRPEDRRSGRKEVAIFSPVGDLGQLNAFAAHIRELGIDGDFDFIFIYRKGLAYQELGLSAIHLSEKNPIGTSGCFFAGQAVAHSLGYRAIVISDLDATLDSARTLREMLRIALEKKVAVVPLSKSPEEDRPRAGYAVVNQWGVVPREALDTVGFEAPYVYKGGEDFEFLSRLRSAGKLVIYTHGFATHPKDGLSTYSKIADRRKYYPYVAGLLKAYVLCARRDLLAGPKYIAWSAYYSFFADAFAEPQLAKMLANPADRQLLDGLASGGTPLVKVATRGGAKFTHCAGAVKAAGELIAIVALLAIGRAAVGSEDVLLAAPRQRLLLGIARAIALFPLRVVQSAASLSSLSRRFAALAFPILPGMEERAAQEYLSLLQ
jgi:hypothetical protein